MRIVPIGFHSFWQFRTEKSHALIMIFDVGRFLEKAYLLCGEGKLQRSQIIEYRNNLMGTL